jgi:hypothetical protein
MDDQIAYVCKEFGISEEQLFTKRRFRNIADARSVLYNILGEKCANRVSIRLAKEKNFHIHRASVAPAIKNGLTYYSKLINNYKLDLPNGKQNLRDAE